MTWFCQGFLVGVLLEISLGTAVTSTKPECQLDCSDYSGPRPSHLCDYQCRGHNLSGSTHGRPKLNPTTGKCECQCFFRYSGQYCEKIPECSEPCAQWCSHIRTGDCTCRCSCGRFSGPTCGTEYCPHQKNAIKCRLKNMKSQCSNAYIKHICPYLCDTCKKSERPTCEEDPECHKSWRGCVYRGKQPTPEMCRTLGNNGADIPEICDKVVVGDGSCGKCFSNESESLFAMTYCPVTCGLCPEPTNTTRIIPPFISSTPPTTSTKPTISTTHKGNITIVPTQQKTPASTTDTISTPPPPPGDTSSTTDSYGIPGPALDPIALSGYAIGSVAILSLLITSIVLTCRRRRRKRSILEFERATPSNKVQPRVPSTLPDNRAVSVVSEIYEELPPSYYDITDIDDDIIDGNDRVFLTQSNSTSSARGNDYTQYTDMGKKSGHGQRDNKQNEWIASYKKQSPPTSAVGQINGHTSNGEVGFNNSKLKADTDIVYCDPNEVVNTGAISRGSLEKVPQPNSQDIDPNEVRNRNNSGNKPNVHVPNSLYTRESGTTYSDPNEMPSDSSIPVNPYDNKPRAPQPVSLDSGDSYLDMNKPTNTKTDQGTTYTYFDPNEIATLNNPKAKGVDGTSNNKKNKFDQNKTNDNNNLGEAIPTKTDDSDSFYHDMNGEPPKKLETDQDTLKQNKQAVNDDDVGYHDMRGMSRNPDDVEDSDDQSYYTYCQSNQLKGTEEDYYNWKRQSVNNNLDDDSNKGEVSTDDGDRDVSGKSDTPKNNKSNGCQDFQDNNPLPTPANSKTAASSDSDKNQMSTNKKHENPKVPKRDTQTKPNSPIERINSSPNIQRLNKPNKTHPISNNSIKDDDGYHNMSNIASNSTMRNNDKQENKSAKTPNNKKIEPPSTIKNKAGKKDDKPKINLDSGIDRPYAQTNDSNNSSINSTPEVNRKNKPRSQQTQSKDGQSMTNSERGSNNKKDARWGRDSEYQNVDTNNSNTYYNVPEDMANKGRKGDSLCSVKDDTYYLPMTGEHKS